jgi:hypothetical protein
MLSASQKGTFFGICFQEQTGHFLQRNAIFGSPKNNSFVTTVTSHSHKSLYCMQVGEARRLAHAVVAFPNGGRIDQPSHSRG